MRYKKKGRLFTRELGTRERIKYLWDKYVEEYHEYPKEIVMTKKEFKELNGFRSKQFFLEQLKTRGIKAKNWFFLYRGAKVIIDK